MSPLGCDSKPRDFLVTSSGTFDKNVTVNTEYGKHETATVKRNLAFWLSLTIA